MFVGNLAPETEGRDLRNLFKDFGTINDAWVARKPPGFGFVWFEDERDAVLVNNPCTMHYADSALFSAEVCAILQRNAEATPLCFLPGFRYIVTSRAPFLPQFSST